MNVIDSMLEGLREVFQWLPNLLAFLAVVLIGWIVARVLGAVVRKVLGRVGLDRRLRESQVGRWTRRVTEQPSDLLGAVTFWLVFLAFFSAALPQLELEVVNDFVAAVWGYVPNVIAALAIFVIAALVAGGATALVQRTMGDTATGRVARAVAPVLIMAIATFMILVQLRIAESIVIITYAALMGAIALGMALAFGLGGREVASDMLRGAYEGQREQVKRDLQTGRERAEADDGRAQPAPEERPTEVKP